MRIGLTVCSITLGLVTSLGAAAAEPEDPCDGSSVTAAGPVYIDDRSSRDNGTWVYRETNGIAGLQRGGDSIALGHLVEDGCIDDLTVYGPGAVPDQLII